jgi:hypothetical protein
MARLASIPLHLQRVEPFPMRSAVEDDDEVNGFVKCRELLAAFCMGLHPRLGKESQISKIDDNIVSCFIGMPMIQQARSMRALRIFKGVFDIGDLSVFRKSSAMLFAGNVLCTTKNLTVREVQIN